MNGTQIVLVQCTNSKRDESAPARNLYDESAYFRDYRAYAIEKGDEWYILSAKHGLLDPETVIDPYDERGLSEAQAESIAAYFAGRTMCADTIEVLAGGRDYADVLVPELERQTAADVLEPHCGLPIGKRRQKAQQAVAEVDG
jgi:hypothetical protein